ncbi:MAG TPA: MFS transporter [Burkholderiales bacterium]|nr:MFS transporter [Burkholderiales bacterium]
MQNSSRNAHAVVIATFATQMVVTMSNSTLPTIAPKLAEALHVEPAMIGYQVSLLFGAAVTGTLFGGAYTRRFGGCRTMQISVALCALGLLFMMVPSVWAIIAGSLVAGFGQGILNSATAHLLVKYTPPERRNFLFSIKQSGVPFGGMVVALTAPGIALALGWQWSVAMTIALIAVVAVLMQPRRAAWDDDRAPGVDVSAQKFGGVPLVLKQPALRWISFTGLLFSAVQRCLLTFTVIYLVAERGYSLIEAGFMLSLIQIGGVLGRLAWGWIADRWSSTSVLLVIAVVTVVDTFALVALNADWPRAAVYAVFFVFGAAALGWNGVLHAEIARLAPQGLHSVVAGGSTFFVFGGVLLGPSLFAMLYTAIGSYSTTFLLMATAAAAGGVLVLVARRDARLARRLA